ncbi:hypothetical protein [Sorangium sp. So ce590]|uniref:hypothetical protein n=1 Tax=unclassified Sorangium TaxID=2621164 RepID=UPI003F62C052
MVRGGIVSTVQYYSRGWTKPLCGNCGGPLGFESSADTLLRLVHHAEVDPAPPRRIVGVDDRAIRRGHAYGTILVVHERRVSIDLLPDRTAARR